MTKKLVKVYSIEKIRIVRLRIKVKVKSPLTRLKIIIIRKIDLLSVLLISRVIISYLSTRRNTLKNG